MIPLTLRNHGVPAKKTLLIIYFSFNFFFSNFHCHTIYTIIAFFSKFIRALQLGRSASSAALEEQKKENTR